MTIDDVEQQIKAKINSLKKILPTYGSGGSFNNSRVANTGEDERINSPDLFNTVVETNSGALQLITNK